MERRPANIQTEHLERCIQALDQARDWLRKAKPGEAAYAVGRAACVKESEVALDAVRMLPEFISDARDLAEAIRGSP